MTELEILLGILFAIVATLYAMVGHAGASGYTAVMDLLGVVPEQIRATAMALNLAVGLLVVARFWSAGYVKPRVILPFIAASIPATYLSTKMQLQSPQFTLILGVAVMCAALAVFWQAEDAEEQDALHARPRAPLLAALLVGGCIGILSGVTGTGGAIFLTPLLLFSGWMSTRYAFGTAAAFVLLNSLTSLTRLLQSGATLPSVTGYWIAFVAVGALIGTHLGIRVLSARTLRYVLGVVLVISAARLLILTA